MGIPKNLQWIQPQSYLVPLASRLQSVSVRIRNFLIFGFISFIRYLKKITGSRDCRLLPKWIPRYSWKVNVSCLRRRFFPAHDGPFPLHWVDLRTQFAQRYRKKVEQSWLFRGSYFSLFSLREFYSKCGGIHQWKPHWLEVCTKH